MSEIVAIDITHHQLALDPPFPASWDPRPRTQFPVTIVRVRDAEGRVGIGSGDVMYGFDDYAALLHRSRTRSDLEQHAARLANIEFHAGRPWPLDVALWDLAGKIARRAGVADARRHVAAAARLRVAPRCIARSPRAPSTWPPHAGRTASRR